MIATLVPRRSSYASERSRRSCASTTSPAKSLPAVVRTGFASLYWTTTAEALVALPLAGPISEPLLDGRSEPGLGASDDHGALALTLLGVRADAPATGRTGPRVLQPHRGGVWWSRSRSRSLSVVGTDLGAEAILLGNFGTGIVFVLWRLWVERRRLGFGIDRGLFRRMIRFGCRRCRPADPLLPQLDRPDHHLPPGRRGGRRPLRDRGQVRQRDAGPGPRVPPRLAAAGVLDQDDDEARNAYALIVTWFVAVCSFAVVGSGCWPPG